MSAEFPSPSSSAFERRYRDVPADKIEILRAGQELAATLERLAGESVDATDVCQQILHMDGADQEGAAERADALLGLWQAEQLAAREGKGFAARVPDFSIWRGGEDPSYKYLAVDEQSGLRADPEAMRNILRRDYVTGDHLFSTATQDTMDCSFAPDDDIAGSVTRRQRGDTKVTWEDFQTAVADTTANLGAYPELTGVILPPAPEQPPQG
jgi:hypothetical protein